MVGLKAFSKLAVMPVTRASMAINPNAAQANDCQLSLLIICQSVMTMKKGVVADIQFVIIVSK